MDDPRQAISWWVLCIVHNCIVHPWLPVAELAALYRPGNRLSAWVFRAHDDTVPEGGG